MIAYNSSVYSPTLNILYCEKICSMGLYTYAIIPTLFPCFLLYCYPYISLYLFSVLLPCSAKRQELQQTCRRVYFLCFFRDPTHSYQVVVGNILSLFPVLHVPVGNTDPQQELAMTH